MLPSIQKIKFDWRKPLSYRKHDRLLFPRQNEAAMREAAEAENSRPSAPPTRSYSLLSPPKWKSPLEAYSILFIYFNNSPNSQLNCLSNCKTRDAEIPSKEAVWSTRSFPSLPLNSQQGSRRQQRSWEINYPCVSVGSVLNKKH